MTREDLACYVQRAAARAIRASRFEELLALYEILFDFEEEK